MSNLREQFEAWQDEHIGHTDTPIENILWDAYQAGHAASGRDDLLEACESALGCDTEMEGVDSPIPKWLSDQLKAAIAKARGQ